MADVTLDKPKTSFSFQGAPGSNSLLFFSFLFSCLLSAGGEGGGGGRVCPLCRTDMV